MAEKSTSINYKQQAETKAFFQLGWPFNRSSDMGESYNGTNNISCNLHELFGFANECLKVISDQGLKLRYTQ